MAQCKVIAGTVFAGTVFAGKVIAGKVIAQRGRSGGGLVARMLGGAVLSSALAAAALAGPAVVPVGYSTQEGPYGHSVLSEPSPYTEQLIYDNSLLAAAGIGPGTHLLGLTMRIDATEYPAAPDTYHLNWRVRIGIAARDAAHAVSVFASNVAGGDGGYTTMRDGTMFMFSWEMLADVATGSDGPANPFGPIRVFDLPFVYTGEGEGLVVEISHDEGYRQVFLDGYLRGSIAGSMSFSSPGFGATAETEAVPSGVTTILAFDVPEPAGIGLLGLGIAGLTALRRRR